jgi:hypothetical protein
METDHQADERTIAQEQEEQSRRTGGSTAARMPEAVSRTDVARIDPRTARARAMNDARLHMTRAVQHVATANASIVNTNEDEVRFCFHQTMKELRDLQLQVQHVLANMEAWYAQQVRIDAGV